MGATGSLGLRLGEGDVRPVWAVLALRRLGHDGCAGGAAGLKGWTAPGRAGTGRCAASQVVVSWDAAPR